MHLCTSSAQKLYSIYGSFRSAALKEKNNLRRTSMLVTAAGANAMSIVRVYDRFLFTYNISWNKNQIFVVTSTYAEFRNIDVFGLG